MTFTVSIMGDAGSRVTTSPVSGDDARWSRSRRALGATCPGTTTSPAGPVAVASPPVHVPEPDSGAVTTVTS